MNPHTARYYSGEPVHGGEGMPRVDDAKFVLACRALGGFPRVVLLSDRRAVWLGPTNQPWRFGAPA